MAWLRIESNFPNHRKVLAAGQQLGRSAIARVMGLWTVGACYAVAHLTDGFVPAIILLDSRYDRHPNDVISAMVSHGLLHRDGDGFRIHDFHDYNPHAAEVKEKRRFDLARKRSSLTNSRVFPNGKNPPDAEVRANFPTVPNPNPNPIPKPRRKIKTLVQALPAEFVAFWSMYPRKRKKAEAAQAWADIPPTPEIVTAIMTALSWQTTSGEWLQERGRFIPYPDKYLHTRRWEDEPFHAAVLPLTAAQPPRADWWEECKRLHGVNADGEPMCQRSDWHYLKTAMEAQP
jgi:hypothetical protein